MLIPFGQWAPDALSTLPGVSHAIRDALPDDTPGLYRPAPTHVPQTTLPAPVVGGFIAHASTGTLPYVGTATGLYTIAATATNVSKSGGYALPATGRWQFAQHRNTVIAASLDAPLQSIAVGSPNFADLVVGTRKPKAKTLAVIAREWLVLGDTTDSVDGAKPSRVWWSRAGDPTRFDPDPQYFCGYQDLDASGGAVMAITGVEFASVLMRNDIWRMTPDTSVDTGFRFDKLDPGNGALCPGGVAAVGRRVFYLSEKGPMVFDGTQSAPIGAGTWARTLVDDLDSSALETVCAVSDPANHLVWWFVPTRGNTLPNKAIVYNYVAERAAPLDVSIEFAVAAQASALYLDSASIGDLSLDTSVYADVSIDSRAFDAGAGLVHAVDRAHGWGPLVGQPGTATLETGDVAPGGRVFVDRFRPLLESCDGIPRGRVRSRETLVDSAFTTSDWRPPALDGAFYPFAAGSVVRFQVAIDGAFHRALGVDAVLTPTGEL